MLEPLSLRRLQTSAYMRKAVIQFMGEVVLGISGASGAAYGVRLAEALQELKSPNTTRREQFGAHYTQARMRYNA
jgi:hypothetical protein